MIRLLAKVNDLCFGVAGILLLVLSIVTFVKLNTSDYTFLNNIGSNWKMGPILSINSETLSCGNSETNLIQDQWQGTSDGCYCPHSFDLFYGTLRSGSCRSKRDSLILCSNVRAVSPIKYTQWKGRQFCAKRMSNSYLDLSIATSTQGCSMNQKPCGVIDTLNNVLCVDRNIECPINEVKVIPSNQAIPTDKKYSVIKANEVNFLFSNENTKGKIINQFKISDNQPCIVPYYENLSGSLYLLDALKSRDKCYRGIGDSIEDKTYQKIDTYNKKNLFIDNQLTSTFSTLPEFNIDQYNVPTSLFVKEYIGVNPSCLKEIKQTGLATNMISELSNMDSNMSTTLTYALVIMILEIISLVFICVFLFLSFNENSNNKMIISCCPITINLVSFILGLILISNINQYSNDYNLLSDSKCVDITTLAALQNFESNISTAYGTNMTVVIFSFYSIIAPILGFIMQKYF